MKTRILAVLLAAFVTLFATSAFGQAIVDPDDTENFNYDTPAKKPDVDKAKVDEIAALAEKARLEKQALEAERSRVQQELQQAQEGRKKLLNQLHEAENRAKTAPTAESRMVGRRASEVIRKRWLRRLETRIRGLQAKVYELDARVSKLELYVKALAKEIRILRKRADELDAKLNGMTGRVEHLEKLAGVKPQPAATTKKTSKDKKPSGAADKGKKLGKPDKNSQKTQSTGGTERPAWIGAALCAALALAILLGVVGYYFLRNKKNPSP